MKIARRVIQGCGWDRFNMASIDRIIHASSATSWKRLPVCVSRARWQTLQLTRYDITSPSSFGTLRVDAIPASTYPLGNLRTVPYRARRYNMEHGTSRSPPPIASRPMSPARTSVQYDAAGSKLVACFRASHSVYVGEPLDPAQPDRECTWFYQNHQLSPINRLQIQPSIDGTECVRHDVTGLFDSSLSSSEEGVMRFFVQR